MHTSNLISIFLAALVPVVSAVARTSAPSGCLTVGSGGYATINAALTALGSGTATACIFIKPGTYNEQLYIQYKGPLTLYGYTTDTGSYQNNQVFVTNTLSSPAAGGLDASSTLKVTSNDFKAYNIDFTNGYGYGAQAVAVTATGLRQGFYACSFVGYQDTLYAKSGVQYYSNCRIEGAVDYVFGDASAWFGECTLVQAGGGAITASSRETSSDPAWYAFDHCKIVAKSGVALTNNGYLGRPWRALARVIFQNSVLPVFINPAGWTTLAAGATPLFYEYGNTGAGASTSNRLYLSSISAAVTKTTVLGADWKSWTDNTY
ncbi:hypothetical protein TWF730_006332 [Orbilia blumenaviensis]|uniref:Pectinesterase n=1 Tax=Orbilia blumenaviensis TaxID=1796055 RepID=A0AAV9VDW9_9PEZI